MQSSQFGWFFSQEKYLKVGKNENKVGTEKWKQSGNWKMKTKWELKNENKLFVMSWWVRAGSWHPYLSWPVGSGLRWFPYHNAGVLSVGGVQPSGLLPLMAWTVHGGVSTGLLSGGVRRACRSSQCPSLCLHDCRCCDWCGRGGGWCC